MVRSCSLLYSYKPTLTYPNVNSHEPALLHLPLVLSLSAPSPAASQSKTPRELSDTSCIETPLTQDNDSGQTDWRRIGSGLWENSIHLKSFKDICALSHCLHKIRFLLENWRCHVSSRQQKDLTHVKLASARDDACQQCNAL